MRRGVAWAVPAAAKASAAAENKRRERFISGGSSAIERFGRPPGPRPVVAIGTQHPRSAAGVLLFYTKRNETQLRFFGCKIPPCEHTPAGGRPECARDSIADIRRRSGSGHPWNIGGDRGDGGS